MDTVARSASAKALATHAPAAHAYAAHASVSRRMHTLAALALGAAFTVPLVHTWAWPVSLLCLMALVAMLLEVPPRRAAWLGWCFSTAWITACTWWLYISMHTYGGLPAVMAAAAVVLLAMALSLYFSLACAVFAWGRSDAHPWRNALLFAAVFMAAELARALVLTGFPWGAAGYTQVDAPLAGFAPWVGVYGMGFALAWVAAAAVMARGGPWRRAMPLALMVVAPFAALNFTTPTNKLTVTLLQTNIPQSMKFDMLLIPQQLQQLIDAVAQAPGDLVIAPETSVPVLPEYLGPRGFKIFEEPVAGPQAPQTSKGVSVNPKRGALVGIPMGDMTAGYSNAVVGVGGAERPQGERYRYDKHHLVPFGEVVPWGFKWFVDMMGIPLTDFVRGPVGAPSFVVAGERIAPNICYEDLFGEELAQRYGPRGDAPTIHANVSNIAWFGDSVAIDQHRNISRLRAMEMQRPMLRATNTGATVVIDHAGVITAALPRLTQGSLTAEVTGREGLTPYVRWVAWAGGVLGSTKGLWPLILLVLLSVGWAGLARRR
jgi:apolipoprotein N-acyltransferase